MSEKAKSYIFYKDDYSDKEFYDLINVQHSLPEFVDLFDIDGEVKEVYSHLFRESSSVEILHENIRISDEETIPKFLLDIGASIKMKKTIIHNAIGTFQLAGDNGDLGFILDVWKNQEALNEDEPIDSYQFWFEDYS